MSQRTYTATAHPVGIDCGDRRPMVLLTELRGSRVLRQIVLEEAEAAAMLLTLQHALRDLAHPRRIQGDGPRAYAGHWPIRTGMTLDKMDDAA